MKPRAAFSTVLFDVDGTLIDSNGAHADTWAQALREHGISVTVAQVRRLIGMGADKLLPAIANVSEDSALGRQIVQRKMQLFALLLPSLAPTNGARVLVEFLRDQGVDLVIATSADDREVKALLQQSRVEDLFPKKTSKSDVGESKPNPDIVQAALKKSGSPPTRALLIGDTPYDIAAARNAGIEAVVLRCGGYWSDSDLVDSLAIFDDPAALRAHWVEKWAQDVNA